MTQMALIETKRLIIRPFSIEDLQSVHNILDIELEDSDFGTKGAQTLTERTKWLQWTILNYEQLAKLNQPPYGDRAIVSKEKKEILGVCGFVPCLDSFEQLCDFDQNKIQTPHGITTTEFGLFYAIKKVVSGKVLQRKLPLQ